MQEANVTRNALKDTLAEAEEYRKRSYGKICKFRNLLIAAGIFALVYLAGLFILPLFISSDAHDASAGQLILNIIASIFQGAAYIVLPVLAVCSMVWGTLMYALLRDYAKTSKTWLMPVILTDYLQNVRYSHEYVFPENEYEYLQNTINEFHEFETKDVLGGQYNDIGTTIFCARMIFKGKEANIDIFHGLIAVFQMNKKFGGETYIVPKRHKQIGKFLKIRSDFKDFNYIYDIYTDDSIEARKIVNEEFTQKLLKLNKLFHQDTVRVFWRGSKVYIELPTCVDNYEILKTVHRPLVPEDLALYYSQIKDALDLIDIIKRNEGITL